MKTLKTLATAFVALSFGAMAHAATIERAGAKVSGASTWVPAVKVQLSSGYEIITTERYSKGRALDRATVYPTSAFDPMKPDTVVKFVKAEFGERARIKLDSGSNRNAGADGILGTGDDFDTGSQW